MDRRKRQKKKGKRLEVRLQKEKKEKGSWKREEYSNRDVARQVGVRPSGCRSSGERASRRVRCNGDIIGHAVSWLDLDGAKERRKVRCIIIVVRVTIIVCIRTDTASIVERMSTLTQSNSFDAFPSLGGQ